MFLYMYICIVAFLQEISVLRCSGCIYFYKIAQDYISTIQQPACHFIFLRRHVNEVKWKTHQAFLKDGRHRFFAFLQVIKFDVAHVLLRACRGFIPFLKVQLRASNLVLVESVAKRVNVSKD